MGFLKLFSGKGPEEYERKGDRFFELGEYGAAKLEYETALDKTRKGPGNAVLEERLREKMGKKAGKPWPVSTGRTRSASPNREIPKARRICCAWRWS